jgi:hypothetical protein
MRKRIFKELIKIEFWVGVNVIGLPQIHTHELAIYKQEKTNFYEKY